MVLEKEGWAKTVGGGDELADENQGQTKLELKKEKSWWPKNGDRNG